MLRHLQQQRARPARRSSSRRPSSEIVGDAPGNRGLQRGDERRRGLVRRRRRIGRSARRRRCGRRMGCRLGGWCCTRRRFGSGTGSAPRVLPLPRSGFCGRGCGFRATGAALSAAGVGCPIAELVSLVVAVCAAAGFAGFGAGGSVRGAAIGAADAPAPGASVRETSPFSGSPGVSPAGLSAAASGGVLATRQP